ncbi:MAG TPA: hypothetical protein PLA94_21420, partial [Myxococcota bacterium]|nr:hypothetical protein [Myxococcota bacterium]
MAEPLPSSGALDAASWNILQVNAQRALQTHDHHDQRLSGLAISPQARLEIASLDATQLRLAGRDVGQALAAQLSIAGDTVPGDLEVQGNLVLRQPLEVGGVVTPRPSPRTATYRAADGRVVETDSTTLQWGRWHDLLSFNINISQATVGLVHFSGDFEPYVDPHNSRDPS